MAAPSLATVLRNLFVVLGCGITATVVYTIATDGLPFRKQLLTPWMAATLVDFYINILVIGAWIIYKESNWIRAIIWIVFLVCLGSITTCGYIVLQFFKLTPQESMQDPIYFVLLKKDGTESKGKLSVVGARVLFTVLGCLMLGTLIYTIAIDGSPFRQQLFTPWFSATLVDFYVTVFALLVYLNANSSILQLYFLTSGLGGIQRIKLGKCSSLDHFVYLPWQCDDVRVPCATTIPPLPARSRISYCFQ
ncbi:uncharacterized protein [Henckelia pumila]|uniref:uncharacterized protein isoform X1 n=1 Tax=Henckelia pumila TaxID=405737 RepID=UPI003C6DB7F6